MSTSTSIIAESCGDEAAGLFPFDVVALDSVICGVGGSLSGSES
jgi:hypothetical protein